VTLTGSATGSADSLLLTLLLTLVPRLSMPPHWEAIQSVAQLQERSKMLENFLSPEFLEQARPRGSLLPACCGTAGIQADDATTGLIINVE